MKKMFVWVVLILFALSLVGCGGGNSRVTVNSSSSTAADQLDLTAVGELAKKAKDAQDFEALLNQPDGINNLDLDEDGHVDYIRVTEFGQNGSKGFSLTADLGGGNEQEVATIVIERDSANPTVANVQLQGNPTVYGDNCYYQSSWTVSDAILLNWLFMPSRPYYYSPYHYGYYPSGYGYYAPIPLNTYRTRTQSITKTTTIRRTTSPTVKSTITSPNAGKSANSIKAPLVNPTTTQRQFQTRNPSKPVGGGGFGKPSAPTSKPAVGTSRPTSTYKPSSSGRRK